jgi:hypothetical protein
VPPRDDETFAISIAMHDECRCPRVWEERIERNEEI